MTDRLQQPVLAQQLPSGADPKGAGMPRETLERWFRQPLIAERAAAETRGARLVLFLCWLAVTAWLVSQHVPWRDEIRALSNAQAGATWAEMLRGLHSEGHPWLWYIILRAAHDLFGVREILPAISLIIAVATAALLAFKAPFRLGVILVLLFGMHLGYEYSVVSRNYGISALILFVIAVWFRRLADRPWFGLLLLLLCNTNVPSVFLAGGLYLYRAAEVWLERPAFRSRATVMLVLNGALALGGAILCFLSVYPPINDAASATERIPFSAQYLLPALFDVTRSFAALGLDPRAGGLQAFMVLSLLVFWRRWPALISAAVALIAMQLFFFFIYPAAYRHAVLYPLLLVTLLWIEGGRTRGERLVDKPLILATLARWSFLLLLAVQTYLFLTIPIANVIKGKPNSNSANLAAILARPENKGATLMVDPDTYGDAVVYFTAEPFWLQRAGRFGKVTPYSMAGNKRLTLDDMLATAERLHRRNGAPVIIAISLPIGRMRPGSHDVMYRDYTVLTKENVVRFQRATRQLASLRGSRSEEDYDVYRYPR